MYYIYCSWFKHILLVNTKGLGMAKLQSKPSPCAMAGYCAVDSIACYDANTHKYRALNRNSHRRATKHFLFHMTHKILPLFQPEQFSCGENYTCQAQSLIYR